MSKLNRIVRGAAVAGLIAATPAIAAGLMMPTQTRASSSLLTASAPLSAASSAAMMQSSTPSRQSPLLIPRDSPG